MPNFAKLMTRKTIILLHKTFKFINDILNYKSILRKKNYRRHLKIKKQAYNINCDYIFNTELLQAEKKRLIRKIRVEFQSRLHFASLVLNPIICFYKFSP